MSIPTAPPPGWYADPRSPLAARWFDGVRWTEHVVPLDSAPHTSVRQDLGPANPLHWVVPVGRSWQSLVAGYVGLLALFTWPLGWAGWIGAAIGVAVGGVAVWLGVLAVRAAATGGHGRGRAWFAIIAGGLSVLACLVLLVRH